MGEKDFQQLFSKKFIEKKYNTKVIDVKLLENKNRLAYLQEIIY